MLTKDIEKYLESSDEPRTESQIRRHINGVPETDKLLSWEDERKLSTAKVLMTKDQISRALYNLLYSGRIKSTEVSPTIKVGGKTLLCRPYKAYSKSHKQ